mgnify:FL=1
MTPNKQSLSKKLNQFTDATERAAKIANLPPDEYKAIAAQKLQIIVNDLLDRMHDEIQSIPLAKLPLSYGILQDKLLQLQGDHIDRPQKTVTLAHKDFNKLLQQLPSNEPITISSS